METSFHQHLAIELEDLLLRSQSIIPSEERMRVDLHCHDFHSDVPDELLGRILGVPETWLPTEELLRCLRGNGTDLITVTNHNNARSCWDLLEKGMDILSGAEWSCTMPDFGVGFHVLTYGFNPVQEMKLSGLRHNIYRFVEYCAAEEIPAVLAHPLHFRDGGHTPPLEIMDRLGLLFERFEVLNGQRDTRQNLLTARWVEGMNPDEIEAMARRSGIPAGRFCRDPYVKRMTGGSDDHFGMYAGSTGTLLDIPHLQERLGAGESRAALALEALRQGRTAPYGIPCEEEKLTGALLDYACQLALFMKDPGLTRLLLHRGAAADKLIALGIANGIFELRRHGVTMELLETIHGALHGRNPSLRVRLFTHRIFRPLVRQLRELAEARRAGPENFQSALHHIVPLIFRQLEDILVQRVQKKITSPELTPSEFSFDRLEIPAHLRALFNPDPLTEHADSRLPAGELCDGLPFPLLAASVLGGAVFASHCVLNLNRTFVDRFAHQLGTAIQPARVLWMTDTWEDHNGVSRFLASALEEIRQRDLPIDLCVISDTAAPGPHLRVLRPVSSFKVPHCGDQMLRLPDLLELQRIFLDGGYDRILSSSEGPMGLSALILKRAFHVPVHAYLHTDWLEFARQHLKFSPEAVDRLRRLLRAWYRAHDGIFVLNRSDREWLASEAMNLNPDAIRSTAHWADSAFVPMPDAHRENLFTGVRPEDPVILYAGRLSEEKGIFDLPAFFRELKLRKPNAHLVIAGSGEAEDRLREQLPDAIFLGWQDRKQLAASCSAADFLILPSRFDTFGCAALEAMACGLPVLAYACKGPLDLILPGQSGYLGNSPHELAELAASALSCRELMRRLHQGALARAGEYQAGPVMDRLLAGMGIGGKPDSSTTKTSSGEKDSFWDGILSFVTDDGNAVKEAV